MVPVVASPTITWATQTDTPDVKLMVAMIALTHFSPMLSSRSFKLVKLTILNIDKQKMKEQTLVELNE